MASKILFGSHGGANNSQKKKAEQGRTKGDTIKLNDNKIEPFSF